MSTTTINLTEKQTDCAETVVLRLIAHFDQLFFEGVIAELPPFPEVDGPVMILPSHEEVIADMLCQLEENTIETMFPVAATNLARKIRIVTGYFGAAS